MGDKFRTEKDSMGELNVPADALYGAQTQRAIDNFPISGLVMPGQFIRALGLIKAACAAANTDLGLMSEDMEDRITQAPMEPRLIILIIKTKESRPNTTH